MVDIDCNDINYVKHCILETVNFIRLAFLFWGEMIESFIQGLLSFLDEDISREGLQNTPARVEKFYKEWLTVGDPSFNCTMFDHEGMDQIIIQRDIPFYSLCEHHLLPFFGYATIGYLPNKSIVGLSKLSRTVEWFASRLQNQERLSQQISNFLVEKLNPKGVGVILKARHMCMEMRGIKTVGAETITSSMVGCFREDQAIRRELMSLAAK